LLILLSFQFNTANTYAQSSELGTANSPPRTSQRPVAPDPFYKSHNSTFFCSTPPKRSECPPYSQIFTTNIEDHQKALSESKNGRPCTVYHDDFMRADNRGDFYNPYAVFSTSKPNIFEADVPIIFDISQIPGPDKEKKYSDFIKRAQACLDQGKPPISDGTRSLKVKIIPQLFTTDQINTEVFNSSTWLSSQVSLHSTYPREDSSNWNLQTDCETINHEILHLLGLHDEYHEGDTDPDSRITYTPNKQVFENELGINLPASVYESGLVDQTAYDCRQTSPAPNLMNDQGAFTVSGFKVFQCKLSKDTGTIQQNLPLTQGRSCPASYERIEIGPANLMQDVTEFHKMAQEVVRSENRTTRDMLFYHPVSRQDIPEPSLRRGQLSQILMPNCMSRPEVRTYLSSARNAYTNRFSAEGGGQCAK